MRKRIKEASGIQKETSGGTKVVLWLDSEKTYRIFENLIVNITKYAMPHTRVYIEMNERPDNVQIFEKCFRRELNFNTEENLMPVFLRGFF